jgi:hypothetical protein
MTMRRVTLLAVPASLALSCAASRAPHASDPAPRAASPPAVTPSAAPRKHAHELGDGGIPPLSAEPAVEGPPAEPEGPSRRTKERHDAVDRLLEGKLSEAEERCRTEPEERREACVDAFLNEHQRKLGERMERSFRGLELLFAYGESRCKAVKGTKTRKRCSLSESERLVRELDALCTSGTDDEQHDCVMQRVIERLGP